MAEARIYIEEVAKLVHHQSDGKALHELEQRYAAPPTLEQRTSLAIHLLPSKRDIFKGSKYRGYRYAVFNPNNAQEKPRILEIIADNKSQPLSDPSSDAIPRCLYAALLAGGKPACNFTGYVFLYTDKYHRLKGTAYLDGQVVAENARLEARPNGKANPTTTTAGSPKPAASTGTSATNRTSGCVHWIDYYASDGTYLTTNCLEYADLGSDLPWGGDTTGPSGPADSPGGGGGGGGGGGCLVGCDPIPLPEDPNDIEGIAIITQPYGFFPGQNVQVTIQYSQGVINHFESRLTGAEGLAQWIHQVGDQRSFTGGTFVFDIAFAVNKILPSGYVAMHGPAHILTGTYNVRTSSGYLAVPKYWD